MAYARFYSEWKDATNALGGGDVSTPLTAAALNHIEDGIDDVADVADAAIPKSIIDAKGDLIVGTAADTPAKLGVGANDEVPAADSTQASGIIWRKVNNAMVATNAAIAVSKLAPGSNGEFLSVSAGTATWVAAPSGGVTVLTRSTTAASANNTTTETTLFTFSVPGGSLSTDKMLRLTMLGDFLFNGASQPDITFRLKYGATTVFTSDAFNVGNGATTATRGAWSAVCFVSALGATNSQRGGMIGEFSRGSNDVPPLSLGGIGSNATEDSTAAKTLVFTCQWASAVASTEMKIMHAILELV